MGGNSRKDMAPHNPPQRKDNRQAQLPQGEIRVIHTIHSDLTMLRPTHNSQNRYAREVRDTH